MFLLPASSAGFPSMPSPLRIGIAGLGTVGAAVIRLLGRQAEALQGRTGRQIVITGVSASRKEKERGVDLAQFAWFDDCVALASSPGRKASRFLSKRLWRAAFRLSRRCGRGLPAIRLSASTAY